MLGRGKSARRSSISEKSNSKFALAAAVLATASSAHAAFYYWSGDQSSGGSVSNPISETWSSATTANWYQDAAGTTTYGVGVNPTSSTSTQIQFGGAAGSSPYTVAANSAITINNIVLDDLSPVTDTLNFTLTGSSKLAMATGTTGAGIVQSGTANWVILNGGAANAPIRFSNSFSISGAGSGNITLSTPLANNGSAINFTVNETGGSTLIINANNSNVAGSGKAFTLTNGTVDFQSTFPFGAAATAIDLNGGTLQSSTGNSLSTYTGGINLGTAFALAGPVKWSLGASAVAVPSTTTITANTAGSTGATIAGAITGAGGITLAPGSTGTVTFTNTGDAYAGPTTINGGTLLDNGNITASAVTVGSTGTFGGTGTAAGPVAVSSGGTLAPGGALLGGTASQLNVTSNLTLNAGAALNYLLNNAATSGTAGGNDLTNVGGTLSTNTNLTINVVPGSNFTYGNYPLINYGTLSDNSSSFTGWSVTGLAPGTGVSYSTAENQLSLDLTAPPAPAAPGAPVYTPPFENPTAGNNPSSHFVGYNENCTNGSGAAESTVNVVLNGNFAQAGDVVNNYPTFGAGTTATTTYNATNNTTIITITGPTPIPAGQVAHIGYSLLNGTGGGEMESPETAYKYWGTPTGGNSTPTANLRLPAPSWFVSNPGQGSNTVFVILYATIELSNGQVAGEWDEQQLPANQPFQVGLGNNDMLDGNMFAFNVGFQFSNTEIPLDDLNLQDYPPSSFTPLPGFTNGEGAGPGGTIESSMIDAPQMPEPASLGVLAIGATALLRRRRRML